MNNLKESADLGVWRVMTKYEDIYDLTWAYCTTEYSATEIQYCMNQCGHTVYVVSPTLAKELGFWVELGKCK
jgi:hypothetical protein